MLPETWRAMGVISIYTALLFFLIGWAGSRKSEFHFRGEIATTSYYAAGIFVTLGVIMILLSFRKKRS